MFLEAKNQQDFGKPQAKGAGSTRRVGGAPGGKGVGTEEADSRG